jgi:type I restriction enzyme S subunit
MEMNPGYRRTEVGLLPKEWEEASLGGKCTKIGSGITPTGGERVYKRGGRPFLRSQNVGWGQLFIDDVAFIDDATHDTFRSTEIETDDVLLNITGASIGRSAVADARIAGGNVNQHVCIIRTNHEWLCPRFLNDFLLSRAGQQQIDSFQAGGNRQGLNFGQIRSFRIPVPPLPEQRTIAAVLSDADAWIESLECLLIKKIHIKQGTMQELLTGKKRLPGFSGKWAMKSLGELFVISGGLTATRDQLSSEGLCYLHYGDIHAAKKAFIDVRLEYQDIPKLNIPLKRVPSSALLDSGDVVFVDASEDVEGASRHIVVVNPDGIPFISGLHTIVAKSKTNELEHRYRRFCFQTSAVMDQFKFFVVGTKVSGISKSNIAKVTLPIPPVLEQAAIATILSDMDSEIATIEANLAKARELKQGVMQELLTGKTRLL